MTTPDPVALVERLLKAAAEPFGHYVGEESETLAPVHIEALNEAAAVIQAQAARIAELEGVSTWPISTDGPHKPDDHRVWLARQLLDSKLDDEEAYGVVAFFPAVSDIWESRQAREVTK